MPLLRKGTGKNLRQSSDVPIKERRRAFGRTLSDKDKLTLVERYHGLVVQEKQAQDQKKEMREQVIDVVKELGDQVDAKTHTLEFDGIIATVNKVSRTIIKDDAEDILKANKVYAKCVDRTINPDKVIEQMHLGNLTEKQVKQILGLEESTRLTVGSKKK